jgi:hypothetical protein
MSCAISRVPTGSWLGADWSNGQRLYSAESPKQSSIQAHPSGGSLTLPQLVSWRRHCGQTSASTRRSIRGRRRWHQWAMRYYGLTKRLPRQRSWSKPRAISSNSSATISIDQYLRRNSSFNLQMDCWSSRELLARGVVREAYRSCCPVGSIASRGASGARRSEC